MPKGIDQRAQRQAHSGCDAQADPHDPQDAAGLSRAQVLTDKGDAGLIDGIHGGVYKALDVGGRGVARHHHRAKGVHRGLDDHVGQGKQAALDARRQADADHGQQLFPVDADLPQVQMAAVLPQHQAADDQHRGYQLGGHGGDGHTGHPHPKNDDGEQIEGHIHRSCGGQKVQGPFGIAYGPEHRRAEVIGDVEGHPAEINAQIQGGQGQHVLRRAHQPQQRRGKHQAHHARRHADDDADAHGAVHRPGH